MTTANIVSSVTTGRIDVDLLRLQRNWLLETFPRDAPAEVDGLVNLLDHLLDAAEGFA